MKRTILVLVVLGLCGLGRLAWIRLVPVPTPSVLVDTHAEPRRRGPSPALLMVVVIDTLRADHVGDFRYGTRVTPAIDRFARESHRFSRALASSSWTRSSVATLLSSRYPSSVRVLERQDELPETVESLAETLRDAGWRTSAVVANRNVGIPFGFGQGFDAFIVPAVAAESPGASEGKIVASRMTESVFATIDAWEDDRPSFLYVHYIDPHAPYLDRPGELVAEAPPGRYSGSRDELRLLDIAIRSGEATETDRERIRHLYAGEVRYVDRWVGRLFEGLKSRGLFEDAMIVLTSDHGEGLWDHGRRNHGADLHEEQIHVPLFVRVPELRADQARTIDEAVSLADVAPTILARLGITRPEAYEGHDLSPLMEGDEREESLRWIYSELTLDRQDFETVQNGRFKLIAGRRPTKMRDRLGFSVELYDLVADPAEVESLAFPFLPSFEEARLRRSANDWSRALASRAELAVEQSWSDLDVETRASLEALGYAEPAPGVP